MIFVAVAVAVAVDELASSRPLSQIVVVGVGPRHQRPAESGESTNCSWGHWHF